MKRSLKWGIRPLIMSKRSSDRASEQDGLLNSKHLTLLTQPSIAAHSVSRSFPFLPFLFFSFLCFLYFGSKSTEFFRHCSSSTCRRLFSFGFGVIRAFDNTAVEPGRRFASGKKFPSASNTFCLICSSSPHQEHCWPILRGKFIAVRLNNTSKSPWTVPSVRPDGLV